MIYEFAEKQWEDMSYNGVDPEITIEYKGQAISNPWMDPTGRFNLTTAGAIDTYGIVNFAEFCGAVAKCIAPNRNRETALKLCYEIPMYDELKLSDKNRIYDEIMGGK